MKNLEITTFGTPFDLAYDLLVSELGQELVEPREIFLNGTANGIIIGRFDGEKIVGVVCGNYMEKGIAGLGQMVTHPDYRGQGHGKILSDLFEQAMFQKADEPLKILILEAASESAMGFWRSVGYRHAQGSRYVQPPLDFDPVTGKPLFEPSPEFLMVKRLDEPDAAKIESARLIEIARIVYDYWYRRDEIPGANDYILGELFPDLAESIRENGEWTRLV